MLATYLKGAESTRVPITLVGTQGGVLTSVSQTIDFGDFSADIAPDDLVVVYFATSLSSDANLSVSGYTEIGERFVNAFTSYDTNLLAAYKFMGVTPDTSITLSAGAWTSSIGGAYRLQVWRNVNKLQPLDVTRTTSGTTNSGAIDPAAITPVTPGACIIAGGARASNQLPSCSSPDLSGLVYTNDFGSTSNILVAMGYKQWTGGTFDPGAFSFSLANSTSFSYASYTIALRPA